MKVFKTTICGWPTFFLTDHPGMLDQIMCKAESDRLNGDFSRDSFRLTLSRLKAFSKYVFYHPPIRNIG